MCIVQFIILFSCVTMIIKHHTLSLEFNMMLNQLRVVNKIYNFERVNLKRLFSSIKYVQGQSPTPKVREYFYYIDHEGMLFLDDARVKNFTSCFKEIHFLKFFFTRIKLNKTDRFRDEFPFVSLCGRERNYIRCDDLPIVFTNVLKLSDGRFTLSYAHAGDQLTTPFQPEKIYMEPVSGRVYHPAWSEVGGIGLIRSKLAIELCNSFEFKNGDEKKPTHFTWQSQRLQLDNGWIKNTIIEERNKHK